MDLPRIRTISLLASIFLGILHEVCCGNGLGNVEYVGCFDRGYSVTQNYQRRYFNPTLENCLGKCMNLKTRYVGIEASDNFCYCGGDIAEESRQRNDSLCDVPCRGMPGRTCGGDFLVSLYRIKVLELPDDHVGFLIGLSIGVRMYNTSHLDDFDTLMVTPGEWVFTVDYHFKQKLMFAYSKRKIYRATINGGVPPVAIHTVTGCEGMAVDWEHDRIYWVSCNPMGANAIMSMDLEGENNTRVLELSQSPIKRIEVDPYAGMLFWVADGTIESCELSGAKFHTNVSAADVLVRTLTLDLQTRRVFYVGAVNHTISLFSMDYDGSYSEEHASLPQMRSVYGLGLLAGRLYWINYANNDVIYTAPFPLNSPSNVIVLAEISRAVWHMRLVHPDLQKPPPKDPQGCPHSCRSQSTASARCKCQTGVAVASHTEVEKEGQEKWLIPAILALIAVVLLLTATLIYVTDKYWPQIQAKLSGMDVPYSRKRDCERENSVTPVYDAEDDNVRLTH